VLGDGGVSIVNACDTYLFARERSLCRKACFAWSYRTRSEALSELELLLEEPLDDCDNLGFLGELEPCGGAGSVCASVVVELSITAVGICSKDRSESQAGKTV
jgi:hypothetical protein